MPPNQFTFTVPEEHGPTIPRLESTVATAENWGPHYYHTIDLAAGNIFNFHNVEDAALDAWTLQQITKPDFIDGPTWGYDYECTDESCNGPVFPLSPDLVTDIYTRGGQLLNWNYNNSVPVDVDTANILGHIIPSRTIALGQGPAVGGSSVVDDHLPLGFGASNQGHSAQYYSNFLGRCVYWSSLLDTFGFEEIDFPAECNP